MPTPQDPVQLDMLFRHAEYQSMLNRIVKLEQDVTELKKDMEELKSAVNEIRSNYATKADLEELRAELYKTLMMLTWRFIGFNSLLVAVVYYVARNVH
ncbi:hypothetical protein [Pseudoduganella violacea]|uniref:Archaellum component FlaC n=1 Tax=Pseudoduganella violacea TaxID=1715466 RepID=A0A7W5FWJ7_9BURK|nr:hypothetical protein [Pseudoduganella violacea]MBB3122090.1 archaellum component FlaC [Pseudoduganella violacea]